MMLPLYPNVPTPIDRRVRSLDPALSDSELTAAACKLAGVYEPVRASSAWVAALRRELL